MIIENKYLNNHHIVYLLHLICYTSSVEFIHQLAYDVMFNNNKNLKVSRNLTLDILEYAISTEKIFIKHLGGKIYNKNNYKELLKIVENNFTEFLDIHNPEFPYQYGIHYTEFWKKELAKIGLWDRETLKN